MVSAARQTELTVDLGDDTADLIRLDAMEGLSQPFTIIVELLIAGEIDLLPHLGKPVTVGISEDDHHLRYFNGIAVDAELVEEIKGAGFVYRMTLRPSAYLHSQGRDFKIFQNQTTQAIIQKILDDCHIEADFKLSGATAQRSYCVQYGESNFGFVSRLMEEEGLYYFYAHTESGHVLTICDSPNSHSESPISPLKFNPIIIGGGHTDSGGRFTSDSLLYVQSWHERVSTGGENKVTLWDFDFMQPNQARKSEHEQEGLHDLDAIEVYDFPGRFFAEDLGKQRATTMIEARRANRRTFSGETQNAGMSCGATFALNGHPNARYNSSYLVTHCHHSIATEHHRAGTSTQSGNQVTFETVPADTKWRAPLTARRPVVLGPETAIVTGPKDETIYTDKFGRIKVKFHWDRIGKYDENSSCWIRVSQTGGLGNNILPRVGHEVIVDFMSGDPDRPVIVGRVFNEAHMPVYALPDNKTKAVWRTLTYGDPVASGAKKELDTKSPNANEFRFEDKAGEEELFIHAQRDLKLRTIRNESHKLGNDQEIDIGQHRKMEIGVDDTVTIGNNRDTKIGVDESREVGNNRTTKVATDETLDVGNTIKVLAGTEILIKAGSKLVLNVGGSTITMDPTSIKIDTLQLTMNGSGTADMTSAMASVKSSGITTIQGSLVKIN